MRKSFLVLLSLALGVLIGVLVLWCFESPSRELESATHISLVSTAVAVENQATQTAADAQAAATADTSALTLSRARELAAEARSLIEHDNALAILLAGQAVQQAQTDETVSALRASLLEPYIQQTMDFTRTIHSASFNRDGEKMLLTEDAHVVLWSLKQNSPLHDFPIRQMLTNAVLSSDEHWLVTTTGGIGASHFLAYVWNTTTGGLQLQFEISGHPYSPFALAFSPDNHFLFAARGDSVQVWDVITREKIREFQPNGIVNGIRFSINGKYLVTFGDNPISQTWETDTGKLKAELKGHTARVNDATFRSDNVTVITGSEDQSAIVWNAENGARLMQVNAYSAVTNVVRGEFYFYTAGRDGRVIQWEPDFHIPTPLEIAEGYIPIGHTLQTHAGEITALVIAPDESWVATSGADGTTIVWDVNLGEIMARLPEAMVGRGAKEIDGHLTIATLDHKQHQVHLWNPDVKGRGWVSRPLGEGPYLLPKVIQPFLAPQQTYLAMSGVRDGFLLNLESLTGWTDVFKNVPNLNITADGNYVTASRDLKHLSTLRRVATFQGDLYPDPQRPLFYEIGIKDDESGGYLIRARDLADQTVTATAHTDFSPKTIVFSRDARYMALSDSIKRLAIFELPSLQSLDTDLETSRVRQLIFSPDARFLLVLDANTVHVVDLESKQVVAELNNADSEIEKLRFSPDGRALVMLGYCVNRTAELGCKPVTSVWNTKTWQRVETPFISNAFTDVVFSPDSQRALLMSGAANIILDTQNWLPIVTLPVKGIVSAQFSTDGKWLDIVSFQPKPRVWDTSSWTPVMELETPDVETYAVQFVDAHNTISTLNSDQTVRLYSCPVCLDSPSLVALANARVSRDLTCAERVMYLREHLTCP